ncbi:hypothetical protein GCM10027290_22130 [Micromonospora sonneratiae]
MPTVTPGHEMITLSLISSGLRLDIPSRFPEAWFPVPRYRAVLFDFFGTLTRPVQRGWRHAAVADTLGCSPDALVDVLDQSYYLRATGSLGDAEASLRWIGRRTSARPSEAALRTALATRFAAIRADTRLRAEAVGALRALRRYGLRIGLVSDCTHELPVLLSSLPVAPLIDARVFSIRLGRCKPDPAVFLTACRRLGVPPEDCLYVGDGGSRELTGATRAGMTAVRLAAPDLDGHLVFNSDTGWDGPTLTSLSQVVDLVGDSDLRLVGDSGPWVPGRSPQPLPAHVRLPSGRHDIDGDPYRVLVGSHAGNVAGDVRTAGCLL